ncbi:LacI family DNA-binding transcriptional regulator [Pleomorphomonas carboxyditropha]|uniref:HTH lacI-type domain-containing protein n=1 Tax=Pleomorphomonas carboxyditropha TaxID=2023338 RepID=A0A2G9WZX6_9HYPH|nr:LacI family DNA-binding transcriptional regulator [Pleomorphomonas carboxyditropha]PIP00278.1 hypothetical protein CJ014_05970 [Pleomorphomonas carboxyditropha]
MNSETIPKPGRRATISTVAADAGVSVAAVSKVLRGDAYGVSEALRSKVMASIERLDYRPSAAARGMRGRTFRVGVLLINITNPFLPEVIDGVMETLKPAGYHAMIGIGQSRTEIETSLIESMIDSRMDGLILVSPHLMSAQLQHFARQTPLVVMNQHEPDATDFDTVNSDDQLGAAIAVRALVERGHTRIGLMLPDEGALQPPDSPLFLHSVMHQRSLGYRRAMQEAGLADNIRIAMIPHRVPGGEASAARDARIRQILSAPDRPSAFFCWSDLVGVHVVNIARSVGLSMPDDLAVIGFDNSSVAALPFVDLASIDPEGRRLGAMAADALLGRINGRRGAEHLKVEPHLVVRSSI